MPEKYDLEGLFSQSPTKTASTTIPIQYLQMTKQFYPVFLGSEEVFCAPHILSNGIQTALSSTPNDVSNSSLNVNSAEMVAYQQRWEVEISSRFREAKKRFPEFFPCFELLDSGRLQYSIHFEPLTGHAKALIDQTPIFPHQKEFKPIEKLWHPDGSSELDILFKRFPTQLVLQPKQPWGTRSRQLLLGLMHQVLELLKLSHKGHSINTN